MSIKNSVKRVLAALLLLIVAFSFAVPDIDAAYGAVRSKKVWGKGVTDEKLNEVNGTDYYTLLPGVNMYACVGYVEWALKNVYEVKPEVDSYPYVRLIRNFFVSKNTKMVGYGNYVSPRYGGDGKFHTHGNIKPGDVVFFFKRAAVNGKVKMKALGKKKHANYKNANQWVHIAILSGDGKGIDAKIHHSSTGNPGRAISMNSSIKAMLEKYDTYWGATDYQVFRVLGPHKGKIYVRLTYEKKDWYNKEPSLAGAKFVVKRKKPKITQKLTTAADGKTDKTEKIRGGYYTLTQVEAPEWFRVMDPDHMKIKVSSGRKKKITVECKPRVRYQTVVIKRDKKSRNPGKTTFRIWPLKYGKYRDDEKWWNSIPNKVKETITIGNRNHVSSKLLPAKCAVFNGVYYIHQIDATKNKYRKVKHRKITLVRTPKQPDPTRVVLKRRKK